MKKDYTITVDADVPDFATMLEECKNHHSGRALWQTLSEWVADNRPTVVFASST